MFVLILIVLDFKSLNTSILNAVQRMLGKLPVYKLAEIGNIPTKVRCRDTTNLNGETA